MKKISILVLLQGLLYFTQSMTHLLNAQEVIFVNIILDTKFNYLLLVISCIMIYLGYGLTKHNRNAYVGAIILFICLIVYSIGSMIYMVANPNLVISEILLIIILLIYFLVILILLIKYKKETFNN